MLKKQICNIEQSDEESLYDYYERFKKLLANYPYHGFAQHDLMMYLHGGLRADDRRIVNSTWVAMSSKRPMRKLWTLLLPWLRILDCIAALERVLLIKMIMSY